MENRINWEPVKCNKRNKYNSLSKILWNFFPVRGFLTTIDNFTDDLELKDDSNNLLLKVPLSGKGIAQPPIPVVATFTPRSGYPGQSIMVTGENFINVDEVRIGDDIVYHETPINSTQIEIIAGDVGGKIKIKTASGEGTSTLVFFVRPIRNPPED